MFVGNSFSSLIFSSYHKIPISKLIYVTYAHSSDKHDYLYLHVFIRKNLKSIFRANYAAYFSITYYLFILGIYDKIYTEEGC